MKATARIQLKVRCITSISFQPEQRHYPEKPITPQPKKMGKPAKAS
jgi:hypothetical protein